MKVLKNMKKNKSIIDVFQFYWNFINEFKDKRTPAMIEDIVDQKITWSMFLHATVKYV